MLPVTFRAEQIRASTRTKKASCPHKLRPRFSRSFRASVSLCTSGSKYATYNAYEGSLNKILSWAAPASHVQALILKLSLQLQALHTSVFTQTSDQETWFCRQMCKYFHTLDLHLGNQLGPPQHWGTREQLSNDHLGMLISVSYILPFLPAPLLSGYNI